MQVIKWKKLSEESPPYVGDYLVTVQTDSGPITQILEFDGEDWIHEGEPTYCHGYYFRPSHWDFAPEPCDEPDEPDEPDESEDDE